MIMMINGSENNISRLRGLDIKLLGISPDHVEMKIKIPFADAFSLFRQHIGKNPEFTSIENAEIDSDDFIRKIRKTKSSIKDLLNFEPRWNKKTPDSKDLMSDTLNTLNSVESRLEMSKYIEQQNQRKTTEIITKYRIYCLLTAASASALTYFAVTK
jgi:hypothetical protein